MVCYEMLWYAVIRDSSEAQRGATWRERGSALRKRGDSVASTWRQRGTRPKFAFFGDQKRGTMARKKRNSVTGT